MELAGNPRGVLRRGSPLSPLPGQRRLTRQIDDEDAALSGHIPHVQLAPTGLDAAAADREPESETGAIWASLHEGLEQLLCPLGRQSPALVLDLDQDALGCG